MVPRKRIWIEEGIDGVILSENNRLLKKFEIPSAWFIKIL